MSLSKLQDTVEDRGAWHATVHGVAWVSKSKSQTQLSPWTTTTIYHILCSSHRVISYGICLSWSGLLHFVWSPMGPSTLLQITLFCPLHGWVVFHCVCVCMCVSHIFFIHSLRQAVLILSVSLCFLCMHIYIYIYNINILVCITYTLYIYISTNMYIHRHTHYTHVFFKCRTIRRSSKET